MQTLSPQGARPAVDESSRRFTIVPMLNGNSAVKEALLHMMASTPSEVHAILSQEDVEVTNQDDKDKLLPKILTFNDTIQDAFLKA